MVEELGARLIRAGLATREQLADALADPESALASRLVDHGVDEEQLVGFFLADGYGPAATAEDLRDGAALSALLHADLAYAMQALPLASHQDTLELAMCDPSDVHARRELARATGRVIRPRVAPVSLLRDALAEIYPDEAPSERFDSETPLSLTRTKRAASEPEEALLLTRQKTPSAVMRFPKPQETPSSAPPPPPTSRPSDAVHPFESAALPAESEGPSSPRATSGAPAADVTSPPRGPASIIPPHEASWGDLRSEEPPHPAPTTPAQPPPRKATLRNVAPPATPPPEIGAVLAGVRRSSNRDEIVRLACEGALTVSRSAVFLALRRGVLRGWEARGSGVSPDAIRNLWIPATSPSMFRAVVDAREPHRGAYGSSAADNLYRAATGSRGGQIEIHPVCVAGRTVAVLCADDVQHGAAGSERIELLAHVVGLALKRLVSQKKGG